MCDFEQTCHCVCKAAVLNAYQGMISSGAREKAARDAALRVYLHHHPEDRGDAATTRVQRWLNTITIH